LDLVEVAPNVAPPVCRVMDFKKYRYEQEKKKREAKKEHHSFQIKEIKLNSKIADHDYKVKLKAMERFIRKGERVKITMTFRGREMLHIDIGRAIIDRFIHDSAQWSNVERPPVQEGRNIIVVFKPK
jgi:translation initiation factor IF-3